MVAALAENGGAHAGIGLMASHGGRAVVEDHQQHVVLVEHGVGKAGHAGVEKRGVADEPDHRTIGNHGEPAAG